MKLEYAAQTGRKQEFCEFLCALCGIDWLIVKVLKTDRTHSSFPQLKAEYLGFFIVELQDVKANKKKLCYHTRAYYKAS